MRSEAVVTVFLQKASVAKRCYATVVEALTNNDGFKEQGITFPNGVMQNKLIHEVYAKCGVDPAEVAYVEAHGTGTKVTRNVMVLGYVYPGSVIHPKNYYSYSFIYSTPTQAITN